MGQKKLVRFEALLTFPNVFQYPEHQAGRWQAHFQNEHPITLELACGKGEYTVGLARLFPDQNFIGVDVKGNRIFVGAKTCLKESLSNAAFLRTQIDRIATYFGPDEVSEIWITFPDPQLRTSKSKKRLTHPKFLRLYQQFLKPGGYIHLKTDSPVLYRFTREVIDLYGLTCWDQTDNLYERAALSASLQIKTHYEGLDIAQSNRIHYIKFSLPNSPLPDLDHQLYERIKQYEKEID